ncbi:MAG TPA: stage III sporulation protein AE [Clostridiales bacterium]|nr:stage III sporulation protein AE [Clostridiales bacterium]
MKKVAIVVAFLLAGIFIFATPVCAVGESPTTSADDIYNSQLENSKAKDLLDELPGDAQKELDNLKVSKPDWRQLNSLSFMDIFTSIMRMIGEQSITPLNSMSKVLAIILLCALLESFKTTFSSGPLGGALGVVSTICICGIIIYPISNTIAMGAAVVNSSASFMFMYIPIMVGLMVSCGQPVTGASYYSMMMGASTVVSQIASKILVPLLNVFLGISVVGAVSPKINLSGVCSLISKVVKWVLTFIMSIFVTMLTMQTIIGTSADSTGVRAARFAISSFVPLVGGALSEAFQTVQGCMRLLKSGVGVFAILGTAVMYLPAVIQCLLWLITINLCAAAGDVFGLSVPCTLLRASGKVLSTMLAILLCCMVIFIISTTIVVSIGGG